MFTMYGLLCSVLLRISGDIRRLTLNSDLMLLDEIQHAPWEICRVDKRASIDIALLTGVINSYSSTLQGLNPNCIVIWHSACMMLTVDMSLLSQAAGRDGPIAMRFARQALCWWTTTPSARRACLHAAQTFRTLSHRKPADGTAFQSVRTLFTSALVLSLYTLLAPNTPIEVDSIGMESFDLVQSDIDWSLVGNRGLSESAPIFLQEEPIGPAEVVHHFIEIGGPLVLDGKHYHPGALYARRILLEFAGLLDEVGTHWMDDYSRLLYMIHDTIVDVSAS